MPLSPWSPGLRITSAQLKGRGQGRCSCRDPSSRPHLPSCSQPGSHSCQRWPRRAGQWSIRRSPQAPHRAGLPLPRFGLCETIGCCSASQGRSGYCWRSLGKHRTGPSGQWSDPLRPGLLTSLQEASTRLGGAHPLPSPTRCPARPGPGWTGSWRPGTQARSPPGHPSSAAVLPTQPAEDSAACWR